MLPILLDHKALINLPQPTDKAVGRVFQALQATLAQKTTTYFRNQRGADPAQLSNIRQNLSLRRMEDWDNRVAFPTLLVRSGNSWTVLIHEKLFDYLAFVLPLRPGPPLTGAVNDERRAMVFAEFALRNHFEHILFPGQNQYELIRSDVDFARYLSASDPGAYLALRSFLGEAVAGVNGKDYLELLDGIERGLESKCRMGRIVLANTRKIAELPGRFLSDVFLELDPDSQMRVLGQCYRSSRKEDLPIVKRADGMRKVLRLLAHAVRRDQDLGKSLFDGFRKKWGVEALFHELDISGEKIEGKGLHQLFAIFSANLEEFVEPGDMTERETSPFFQPRPESVPQQAKSLKERIEEARLDPDVPQSVLDVIEKNKMNAAGQSGAKYAELIETLLAIPWAKIKRIRVSPEEFEDGLNRSHYGLKKPKEIICDFFANLIWRYRHFRESEKRYWRKTGSALLFVGPPGVGKTSIAISIAKNLGIPYHKLSLGGMKDEADIRGYGFTYEGSKPGPIVQGLVKMGLMNGMFIMDEADKTEKIAIATLLEILDPEQNHLYHDKYTQSTVDIDLSNCHFILTANTIDTVPSAIINRCEVIFLDRYSVEEKIAIAKDFLLHRIRERYLIGADEIFFDAEEETDIIRHLIRDYTFEAGVRDLERIIRTLFLRVQRKEIMGEGKQSVKLTSIKVRKYLDEPNKPRLINEDDRVGEMMGLGVNMDLGIGSLIPIQVTPMASTYDRNEGPHAFLSMVHTTGNIERVMDESRKVASTAIMRRSRELGIDPARMGIPVHLHFMGGSTKKDGPSSGSAIALALASLFKDCMIRRDVAITGEIDTQGRITGVGGIAVKLETAYAAGCKTLIIPKENLHGTDAISRLPDALKHELQILTYREWKDKSHEPFDYTRHMLQVVAVEDIVQAADVSFIDQDEIDSLGTGFEKHARKAVAEAAENVADPFKRLRLIYLDTPEGITPGLLQSGFCTQDYGCVILVRSDAGEDITARLPRGDEMIRVREFDPSARRFAEVINELKAAYSGPSRPPLRITIIAPLMFLRREGIRSQDFPPGEGFVGLRVLASCCTEENVQIKECRWRVSEAYPHLARLSDKLLRECPFLAENDGIYSISVDFIPEKYRIDSQRAEEILDQGISIWLSIMNGELPEPDVAPEPCLKGHA